MAWVSWQINITGIYNSDRKEWTLWATETDSRGDWVITGHIFGADKREVQSFLRLYRDASTQTDPLPEPPAMGRARRRW